jgi:putative N-acetyltransferase (TIGR04045 family)
VAVAPSRSRSEAIDVQPAGLACRAAGTAEDVLEHHRIREAVFVTEQELFPGHDRDQADEREDVIHVVGYVDGVPAGAVRLYPVAAERPGESLWKGDRLAVLPDYRRAGLGAPLVRYAVATAGALGGDRMIAYIQPDNVVFFRRLGWSVMGEPAPYVGLLHQKMSIGLG